MDIAYPPTRKVRQIDRYFGVHVEDPYRWLEDDNSPETKAWVDAQNQVTNAYLDKIPYRNALRERLRSLLAHTRYSGAFHRKGLTFHYRNNGLQNQSVLMVAESGKPERVLLDPNRLAEDGTASLGGLVVSRGARFAAYGVHRGGSDWLECRIIDIATGQTLPETLEWLKFGLDASWVGDNGFYYTRYPKPPAGKELTARNADHAVFFHKIGTPQEADRLVYAEPNHPDRTFGLEVSADQRWEILTTLDSGKRGNGLWVRPLGSPASFRPIVPFPGDSSFTFVDTDGGKILLLTNWKARNGRVIAVDPSVKSPLAGARTVIAEGAESIDSIRTAGGRLLVHTLKDANTRVAVHDRSGKRIRTVALPGLGTASFAAGDPEDTHTFFTFTSYNVPGTQYRYDLATGASTKFKEPAIPGFRSRDLAVEQVFCRSKDGTRVPMFLVHRRGLRRDGNNPVWLNGYGGFNVALTPWFSAFDLAWLEQGGVMAVANLRGGSEYGERWHEAGMRFNKQNVFDDCIACAQWLIQSRITRPRRLALEGGSNGGLLVGAVVNQRPDLFGAAIPRVGVMDMLRFQKFSAGKYWPAEYGSSGMSAKDLRNLMAFSPVHNIRRGAKLPAILVTTADKDDRVVPAHSFKYTATLQEKADRSRPRLIRVDTESGHGSSNLTKGIDEHADILAFLFHNLGVTPRLPGA
jgi:prolyl oligopeptidase